MNEQRATLQLTVPISKRGSVYIWATETLTAAQIEHLVTVLRLQAKFLMDKPRAHVERGEP